MQNLIKLSAMVHDLLR